jgi:hypothetical protein
MKYFLYLRYSENKNGDVEFYGGGFFDEGILTEFN